MAKRWKFLYMVVGYEEIFEEAWPGFCFVHLVCPLISHWNSRALAALEFIGNALEFIGIPLEFIGIHWNCIGIHWKPLEVRWEKHRA